MTWDSDSNKLGLRINEWQYRSIVGHSLDGTHRHRWLQKVTLAIKLKQTIHESASDDDKVIFSPVTVRPPGWFQLSANQRYEVPFRFHTVTSRQSGMGANIPPELFDIIVSYVIELCDERGSALWSMRRIATVNSAKDWRHPIKLCSLVCRHWANICRRRMFSGVTLTLTSPDDVEILKKYAIHGCPKLLPILQLIGSIVVEQTYEASRSFCHVTLPAASDKLRELRLFGPIPAQFSQQLKLDSPHWSYPPHAITTPSLLQYDVVSVRDIHLPSFAHIVRYVRHFIHAEQCRFKKWTWEKDTPQIFRYLSRRSKQQSEWKSIEVDASECKNNFLLCLQAAVTHPSFLLHALPRDEFQETLSLMFELSEPFSVYDASDDTAECIIESGMRHHRLYKLTSIDAHI